MDDSARAASMRTADRIRAIVAEVHATRPSRSLVPPRADLLYDDADGSRAQPFGGVLLTAKCVGGWAPRRRLPGSASVVTDELRVTNTAGGSQRAASFLEFMQQALGELGALLDAQNRAFPAPGGEAAGESAPERARREDRFWRWPLADPGEPAQLAACAPTAHELVLAPMAMPWTLLRLVLKAGPALVREARARVRCEDARLRVVLSKLPRLAGVRYLFDDFFYGDRYTLANDDGHLVAVLRTLVAKENYDTRAYLDVPSTKMSVSAKRKRIGASAIMESRIVVRASPGIEWYVGTAPYKRPRGARRARAHAPASYGA